jgi:hypothetical protein
LLRFIGESSILTPHFYREAVSGERLISRSVEC